MVANEKMTADKAYGRDVKNLSYDELMEIMRFLDQERQDIKKNYTKSGHSNDTKKG